MLAAGGSSRLGRPKQLLPFEGEPLVRRAARAALEAGFAPVVVVVGGHAAEVRAALAGLPVEGVENAAWQEGMAGSVRLAVARLAAAGVRAAALLGCDQPHLGAAHLVRLEQARLASGAPVAASEYAGTRGVPAVFDAALFPELLALGGDRGAKSVIARDPSRVVGVPFPGGEVDVDHPEDWERLGGGR
ncbi:MAG TPA: nucleotidyltransferase family protein [Anaeromyxobacteraceae bacterium]|nr:nucleotidyltransferase family protein [Anaeromyxobacteraceae bacterium]